eukprot:scaffold1574_cov373-Prasinococcus_capsulatus_cf.AAC.16
MLQKDPAARPSAKELLQHEWIKENGVASDKPLDNEIAQRLQQFKNMNYLKKAALQVVAKSLSRLRPGLRLALLSAGRHR